MTRSIRSLAIAVLGGLLAIAVWLTYQQAIAAPGYADDPRNARADRPPVDDARGRIVTADGVVVAEDHPEGGRRHLGGSAYTHLVGHDDLGVLGSWGLEATRRHDLASRDDGSISAWLTELFGGDLGPPDVRITVLDRVQREAAHALGAQRGAVVALDPRTGAVIAAVSSPSFDVDDVATGALTDEVVAADPSHPDLDRTSDVVYPPGSTFKVVIAGAAIDVLGETPSSTYDDATSVEIGGLSIANPGRRPCGSSATVTLADALAGSCNTVFAELALQLGAHRVVEAAATAGFDAVPRWELGAARSSLTDVDELAADPFALALTGIGERDVRTTPLHLALVAGAVANDGVAMQPYVVGSVVSPDDEAIETTRPEPWSTMMPAETAEALTDMMVGVVEAGTGRAAQLPGTTVAGKTGTAEGGGGPHAWFIGFAPADDPSIAIAVLVEGGGRLGEDGTGGSVAAPIAARVMAAWLEIAS